MNKLVVLSVSVFVTIAALAAEVVSLDGEWDLCFFPQPDDGAVRTLPLPDGLKPETCRAEVPGCCELELMKMGKIALMCFSVNILAFFSPKIC